MTLNELARVEPLKSLHEDYDDRPVSGAYTSDLLSDVMAHAKDGDVLITIQAHHNAVAVASLAGVAAILVCGNRPVTDAMLAGARRERLAVFTTALNQFEASCLMGRLLSP